MRLAGPVYAAEGALLFAAGTVLSASILELLKQRGVARLFVDKTPDVSPAPGSPPENAWETAREMVEDRFRETDRSNPHVDAVFHLALERQYELLLRSPGTSGASAAPAFRVPKPGPVRMETLVAAGLKIGTLPVVFHRLVEIINSPFAAADDAAAVIATDPALSAKLLRLVNSPFYGLATRIDTISRAVVLVGTGQLVMLAMGATLITAFKGMPSALIDMQSFWNHSIACGVAARLMAQTRALDKPESYFVSGLLHDIARLVIYTQLPSHGMYMLTEARRRRVSVRSLEKDTLGFTHEELGAELLRTWLCPEELADRVLRHHEPLAPGASAERAILPAANFLSNALAYGSSGGSELPAAQTEMWRALGLTPQQLIELCRSMDTRVSETHSMLSVS